MYKVLVSGEPSLGYHQDSYIRNSKNGRDCKSCCFFVVLLCLRGVKELCEVTVLYLNLFLSSTLAFPILNSSSAAPRDQQYCCTLSLPRAHIFIGLFVRHAPCLSENTFRF